MDVKQFTRDPLQSSTQNVFKSPCDAGCCAEPLPTGDTWSPRIKPTAFLQAARADLNSRVAHERTASWSLNNASNAGTVGSSTYVPKIQHTASLSAARANLKARVENERRDSEHLSNVSNPGTAGSSSGTGDIASPFIERNASLSAARADLNSRVANERRDSEHLSNVSNAGTAGSSQNIMLSPAASDVTLKPSYYDMAGQEELIDRLLQAHKDAASKVNGSVNGNGQIDGPVNGYGKAPSGSRRVSVTAPSVKAESTISKKMRISSILNPISRRSSGQHKTEENAGDEQTDKPKSLRDDVFGAKHLFGKGEMPGSYH